MNGTAGKVVERARKALHKAVVKQRRKRAMAKAGEALKTVGKAAAAVGVVAGAAFAARSVAKRAMKQRSPLGKALKKAVRRRRGR